MKTLAVVPARAGSKGLPGKNSRLFHGKPLAQWAIECGLRTCARTVVTTDDPAILELAEQAGAESLERPHDLAQDDTPMLDVLRHVLAMEEPRLPDVLVLLQPTQPLRRDEHVEHALSLLVKRRDIDSVVSVVQIPAHMSPDYAVGVTGELPDGLLRFHSPTTRRQDCRPAYYRDGTVYAIRSHVLACGSMYGRALPLVLQPHESVTIDVEADWARAEEMYQHA